MDRRGGGEWVIREIGNKIDEEEVGWQNVIIVKMDTVFQYLMGSLSMLSRHDRSPVKLPRQEMHSCLQSPSVDSIPGL